jgi:uncharacterized membrane protein YgdD (TMEM256/DUF423 family)
MSTAMNFPLHISPRLRMALAALCGFSAVLLGAFGAHAFRGTLTALGTVDTWNTASLYHLVHAVVLVWLAEKPAATLSYLLFLAGVTIFSGSLYLYAVTGIKTWAMFAPVGGTCLLLAWLALIRLRIER